MNSAAWNWIRSGRSQHRDGNAATALSSLLQCEVRIEMPEVRILGYNEAIDWTRAGGDHGRCAGASGRGNNGIMVSVQQMDFTIRSWAA